MDAGDLDDVDELVVSHQGVLESEKEMPEGISLARSRRPCHLVTALDRAESRRRRYFLVVARERGFEISEMILAVALPPRCLCSSPQGLLRRNMRRTRSRMMSGNDSQ